ncbi:hypothetical protein COL154_014388, partial [Colletotrichum chrysophilum]
MASRRESDLMHVFTAPSRDPDVVNYRNAVFLDLEDEAVFALISAFCDAMRGVRGGFDYAGRIRYNYHRKIVLLDTAMSYCAAIRDLDLRIAQAKPRSAGLVSFWRFLRAYAGGSEFAALSSEAASVREALSSVTYDMLIRLGRVTVRKSSSETDYALKVFETFERFRHGAAQNYLLEFPRDTSLNHVEAGILERVGKLYPEIFGELDRFCDAMIAIAREASKVEKGEWPKEDNPLVNAPHTAAEVLAGDWAHPYSRLEAAHPSGDAELASKYWPPVSRIDNVAGDRNL